MTLRMILDRMAKMIRPGFVNARMPEKMRVKVTLWGVSGAFVAVARGLEQAALTPGAPTCPGAQRRWPALPSPSSLGVAA